MGLIGKLKRKDVDQVNNNFSDFSLSSPATKIRRLDADSSPIIEEESFPENHERAIVLFNTNQLLHHNNTPPLCSSPASTPFFSLHADLISGFKNQLLRATESKSAEAEEIKKENLGCLAVVPWVPSQIPSMESRDSDHEVPMETDEMDVEENCSEKESMQEFQGLKPRDGFHQQQQHCMLPQPPPQNPFTPITWSDLVGE
ncbi:hypothetical protein V6N13_058348 [Hibiscus sabdariffa]|uniref:Uncharacterized protein n=1 Tax=Hibiscus sabdariffa TaxID=183260 RepID=A0ABR2GGZ4_9ROSI